jgi:hypothetical protein
MKHLGLAFAERLFDATKVGDEDTRIGETASLWVAGFLVTRYPALAST